MTPQDSQAVPDSSPAPLKQRTWHYLLPPAAFEIAPCSCGNHETQWSEFKEHLWCAKCEKDFIPTHGGVFDGPIGVKTAEMLGVVFHRFNMETGKAERFDTDTLLYAEDDSLLAPRESATA